MFDLIIRGGTLVDGTGAARRTADVAVAGGTIVEAVSYTHLTLPTSDLV